MKKSKNNIFSKIRKKISSLLKRIKNIKPADAAVLAGVIVLSGIIIVPSVVTCVVNYKRTSHEHHIYKMLSILVEKIEEENDRGGTYWHDLISNENYLKLLSSLTEKTGEGKKYPASMFYMRSGDDKLYIMSKKYRDMTEKEIRVIPSPQREDFEVFKPWLGNKIVYLSVIGPDTYYLNDSLDADFPDKLQFKDYEIDNVINNLKVSAVYQGGRRIEIPRYRYTVTGDELDMSKPGQTRLTVTLNSVGIWDYSVYAPFIIDVVGAEDVAPLVVDTGINGRYELASYDWKSYVDEAAEQKNGKTFGASIVSYNGRYYYFPDGMYISGSGKNMSPIQDAYDTDNHDEHAYFIEFDLNSIIRNSSDEANVHAGSIKAENELIYIYQVQPSKEYPEGWIRVYCELNKF